MLDLYKNIRKKRKELGLTQTELALKTGYTNKSTIASIESGKIDLPQSKIKLFAQVLECTPSELMGWNDEIYTTIPEYDENTPELIDLYLKSTPEQRKAVISLLHSFVHSDDNSKSSL